jgi:5-formyltetrahydrofolate cyclo-ligase
MPLASTQAAKIELRRGALVQRSAVFAARGAEAADAMVAQLNAAFPFAANKIIAGYWPIGSEIDCRPAMAALHHRGALMCLPIAGQRGDRLVFRRWVPGDALEQGPFGTFHPAASAASIEPDILLIPLLAFDSQGHRLGYGAGYYDRTLSAMRSAKNILAWGIAFDEQETPIVPAEPTDAELDGLITDKRLLRFAATQ